MVAIKRVSHVEKIERDNVRRVLLREQIRAREVEDCIPGGSRLGRENTILMIGHDQFRVQQESFVSELKSRAPSQRRNSRQRGAVGGKFCIYVIKSEIQPDCWMQCGIKSRLSSQVPRSVLVVLRHGQSIFNFSRRRQEDKISDVIVEAVRFK